MKSSLLAIAAVGTLMIPLCPVLGIPIYSGYVMGTGAMLGGALFGRLFK